MQIGGRDQGTIATLENSNTSNYAMKNSAFY